MISKFWELFTYDIGIDLGTANILVYVKGKGIIIREPSVVVLNKKTKELIALGSDAKKMFGKTPGLMTAVRPLRDGVISDFVAAEKMISYYIKLIHKMPSSHIKIPKPRIVIGVPSGVTSVERKAVVDAARNAGAREVYLVEEPMAAAIGADLPVTEPRGTMIVDMGGGTTEIAVISLSGIVVNKSIRVAGDEMDAELVNYAKSKHNILIGERNAEEIKFALGNVIESPEEIGIRAVLRGRDLKTGLPKAIEIEPIEIREALRQPVYQLIDAIKDTIEETPADLMADIVKEGIVLAGGTSLLRGMDKLLSHELRVSVRRAKEPMTCVVRGCAKLLDNKSLLDKVKINS